MYDAVLFLVLCVVMVTESLQDKVEFMKDLQVA